MATADDYAAWIVANADKKGTPDFETVAKAYQSLKGQNQAKSDAEQYAPTVGMSGTEKFLAGTGKAFHDLGQGAGQLLGLTSRDDVAESRRLDAPLMKTGAGTAGNILGNVAAFAPTALIPGANTITGAGLIGAGSGLLQPSTSTGETAKNVGIGAVAGAAIPAAITGYKTAKSFIEPFYQGGRDKILSRALQDAAGGESAAAVTNLQNAKELVPGSLPTAGEASGVPSIAALQRTATAIDPLASNQLAARNVANNEARLTALRKMAGADGARDAAKSARDTTANKLYGEARAAGISPEALTPEAQANIAGFMNRMPDEVLHEAQKLAKINGEPITEAGSINGLHWMKKGLDSLISKEAGPGGSKDLLRAYTGLKNDFVEGIGNLSPKYAEASQTFAAMSKPINQMDVAKTLMDKAVRPLDEQVMPGLYSRNLSDALAQKVTGIRSNTLEKVMEPGQLAGLNAIKEDLARKVFSEQAGRGVGSDTVQKLAYSNMLNQAGVPSFIRNMGPAGIVGNVAQRFGQVAYKDANDKMAQQLALALLNPAETAKLFESGIITPQMKALANGLRRSGAVMGASAPGLVQSLQQ